MALSPRQADVAFVLEGVPGVAEVYSIEQGADFSGGLEFAVRLVHGGDHLALAHYALLRVLSHHECEAVLFFEVDLPPFLRKRASRLELSNADREAARGRVAESSPALEQQPVVGRWPPPAPRTDARVLIVDHDVQVHRAVSAALGATGARVIESDPYSAFFRAQDGDFDLILCDAHVAFGQFGLLSRLLAANPIVARRVVILAHESGRDLLITCLDDLGCCNGFLLKPVDFKSLRELLGTRFTVQRWNIPVLPARGASKVAAPEPGGTQLVIVVDDDADTKARFATAGEDLIQVVVTSDEWEAVDLIDDVDVALVLCSVSLRTASGTPLYRLLWNARPEIKKRFVFIARSDAAPPSAADKGPAAVVQRPLTRDAIAALLERFAAS